MTVVVRCTLIAAGRFGRGAPRWPPRSCGRTGTAPLTPCVVASTRGRTRNVGTGLRDAAPITPGATPGLTAMRAPARLAENVRLTMTVERSNAPLRWYGRK